jgi:RHS repeat-associated protein
MPFGVQRSHSGANASDYKYTDQELDNESVLYNYDARMYDPVIGRFISGDTMVPDWYDPQSLNRYSYCLNNPLKYKDPNGHWALQVFGTVMGAGINALKNYDAVSSGAMTKGEYARSIAVGGGRVFCFVWNVDAVSILLGGAASAVNEIHEQTLNGKLVSEMDKGEIFKAG